ncbi:lipid II:glycine glycyltransferase FemX [Sphingomonas alpina]|uniref:Peptidoglycan bridge formation glycyltransferase FemA/FemB family protein n=1 Tax=Sphingomonas alpina TaxID=653931 RepID=A0A7H0LFX3_9SPHN|nr:GNAT family N-acetyltransferase [Sphingomonas alpina]QNQ08576.1 peptidoglycan bridge formation glycyltransferase FemA/FemB family protein [Sphingomonas alpina]
MQVTAHLSSNLDVESGSLFDRFALESPFAAYQQSRAWVDAVPHSKVQDYLFFRCLDGDTLIGTAVVRRTRLFAGRWLATVQRGPVVHDATLFATVLSSLARTAAAQGCCTMQLAPRVRGRDLPTMSEALRAAGFAPLPTHRQPLHSATGIVWLDKPEEEILAGFKQRGRRQLKAAAKAGVTVRRATGAADVAAYQRVLDAFRAAKADYDMNGLPDAAGQVALVERLGGALLLAERDGIVIGGHVFVRQADEAIWLSLATSDDDPSVPRSYPLLWEGMRLAREMGCIGYDLAGLPVGEAQDGGEANRSQFKSAFAPTHRVMPPVHVAALKPLAHTLLFNARQIYRAVRAAA